MSSLNARQYRSRTQNSNENDENSMNVRITRSKAAAQAAGGLLSNKEVEVGRTTRRRVLGDLSNTQSQAGGNSNDSKSVVSLVEKDTNVQKPQIKYAGTKDENTTQNDDKTRPWNRTRYAGRVGNNIINNNILNTSRPDIQQNKNLSVKSSTTTSTTITGTKPTEKNLINNANNVVKSNPISVIKQQTENRRKVLNAKASSTTVVHRDSQPLQPIKRPAEQQQVQQQEQKKQAISTDSSNAAETGNPPATKKPRVGDYSRSEPSTSALSSSSSSTQLIKTVSESKPVAWDDLDADDGDDPLMVSEYVVDIFTYLYQLELTYLPDPYYFDLQTEFTPKMRGVLMDWVIQVHNKFRLLPETLFLAANIIDRYFSRVDTDIDQVQAIGAAGLYIASKVEEIMTPALRHFAYLSVGYTEEDIIDAEKDILRVLEYNTTYPNPLNFLRRISKADDYDIHTRTLGKYLLEISVVDHLLMAKKPSLLCAAAMYLSRWMFERDPKWNANLAHYSGDYQEEEFLPIVDMMIEFLAKPITHENFFKKYASKKFFKVSILARTWAKREMIRRASK